MTHPNAQPTPVADSEPPPDSARVLASNEAAMRDGDLHPAHVEQLGTSYLDGGSTDEAWQRWREIQADFVDEPRNAVNQAHDLVGQLIDEIVQRFDHQRKELEQRWTSGEDVSTEDLRHCLQQYRDFFGRLLANR